MRASCKESCNRCKKLYTFRGGCCLLQKPSCFSKFYEVQDARRSIVPLFLANAFSFNLLTKWVIKFWNVVSFSNVKNLQESQNKLNLFDNRISIMMSKSRAITSVLTTDLYVCCLQWRTQKRGGGFHGGFWFRVVWWSFVFGVRCLWRHNLTSFPCFQTNVLAKFLDITMHIFLHPLPLFHVVLHWT